MWRVGIPVVVKVAVEAEQVGAVEVVVVELPVVVVPHLA
jgi:hypothetical protein